MRILFLVISAVFAWQSGYGQQDLENSSDHALLTRYPGSYIAYYETIKYIDYDLALGPVTGYRHIEDRTTASGQLTRITYLLERPVDKVSITEVYKDYLQAMEKAGMQVPAKGQFPERNVRKDVGGGSWIGVALQPQPFAQGGPPNYLFAGTSTSGGTFSIIGQLNRPEGVTYAALYGERHSAELVVIHLDIIETKAAETGQVSVDANYLKSQIEDRGSVSIYGIQFDYNSSRLKSESAPTLTEVAKYLKANPGISLYVVGHTDMKGSLEYNLKLSEDRAAAVVDALSEKFAIDRQRLIPQGVAFLSPMATNTTEEGRALNRRTELVRRSDP